MKAVKVGLVALALTMVVVACAGPASETTQKTQPPEAASPGDTARTEVNGPARANFERHCAACHGTGDGGLVKIGDKSVEVPSLKQGHAVTHTDEQLIKQIADGDDEMPAFKDKLTPEEINGLVNFIRKGFQRK